VDFLLLQAVCERATGRSLDVLIEQFGLANTLFGPIQAERCVPTEVDERWRGGLVCGEVHDEMAHTLGGVAGHAGLFATAQAVGRFCEAWLQDRLVSPAMRRQAFAPHSDQYGLGWRVCNDAFFSPLSEWDAVGHLGFTGTSAFVFPATQTVFVLLSNRVYPHRDAAPSRLPLLREIGRIVARQHG
jgi:CubicO group peptidase (beta-lactamase class C family)